MSRASGWTLAGLALLAALLVWFTLSVGQVECAVCMEFGGGRNCATAAAEDEATAFRSARSTACGTLTHGIRDAFACDSAAPASRTCNGGPTAAP